MPRAIPFPSTFAIVLAASLSACAARTEAPQAATASGPTAPGDPYEMTNRDTLNFNLKVDDAIYRPAAEFYRQNVGAWTRARVRNVLRNLEEPSVAASALLQARPIAAGTSIMRFAVNSTLGLGGLFDLEPIGGPPRQEIDFGQTLYAWGLPDGPYLMLPFAGPSTPRDLAGSVGDGLLNPLSWTFAFAANAGRAVALGLDERERNIEALDDIRNNSLDPYARLRSLWRQNRDAQLGATTVAVPEVLEDPEAPGAGADKGGGGRPDGTGVERGAEAPHPGRIQAARRTVRTLRVPTRAPRTAAMAPSSIAANTQ